MLCVAYALIAVLALVTTYSELLPFPQGFEAFWGELKVNHVSRGIAIDLAFFVLAGAIFIVAEARRLKMRFAWLYVLLAYLVDVSVFYPIFLIMRERAMARAGEESPGLVTTDVLTIAAIGAAIAWQVWFLMN
jgi:hypothetical protein